ncbi:MAG TPA: DUF4232 domain-containing protein [Bryobacteraceae bacterium]
MRAFILFACATACVLNAQGNAVPACEINQLKVTIKFAGAGTSVVAQAIEFFNKSVKPCQLKGVPIINLLKADGQRLPIPECPDCPAYLFPAFPIRSVVLKPGGTAHVLMQSVTGGYDEPLCSHTEYDRIALSVGKPAFLVKNRGYSCVSLTVSPYLPGPESSDLPSEVTHGLQNPAPHRVAWGKPVDGVELSLTPFASEQETGYLGFRVLLRGMNKPGAPSLVNCDTATLRIWRGGRLIRELGSSSSLACVQVEPPVRPYTSLTGGSLSTAFFNVKIEEPGTYSFDLVEHFKGNPPVTLISNRVAVQVIRPIARVHTSAGEAR